MPTEMQKLAACLKDNKSWMPASKKKAPSGMNGNEDGAKTSEVQKLAELMQKRAAARAPMGFMQRGMNQVAGALKDPSSLSAGVSKAYNQGAGMISGIGNVAQKYAPGAAVAAIPLAAGAALGAGAMGIMGGNNQQQQQGQVRMAEEYKTALSPELVGRAAGRRAATAPLNHPNNGIADKNLKNYQRYAQNTSKPGTMIREDFAKGMADGRQMPLSTQMLIPGLVGAAGAAGGYALGHSSSDQQRTASLKTGSARIAELSKAAWSLTEPGHALDAARYNADSEASHKKMKAHGDYADAEGNHAGILSALDATRFLAIQPFGGGSGSHLQPILDQVNSRHNDYAAKKHEKGENAYNPFGGWLTKSRHEEKDEKGSRSKKDDKKTEKKSSFGPQMHALREKIAVLPLAAAAAAVPAAAGAAKGLLAGAAGRYVAGKAVPMAMNAGMNMLGAGPGVGNKMKAGLAGAATGLIPGSGIASQVAGMAAQPLANKAFGVG